jgi:cell volume regulation protein A
MTVVIFLTLIGSILLLGVLGNFFFSRTRIPNSVVLMIVGMLIGPIGGFLDGSNFQQIAPYFGTIALILILFEGGLEIDIFEAVGQARTALLLSLTHFALSVGGIFAIAHYVFLQETSVALLYGFVLSGTSPAVVLPVLQSLELEPRVKALFALETVVTEVLTIVCTVLAIDFMTSTEPPSFFSATFFVLHSFGTAAGIAILAAWAWNWGMPLGEKSGMSHLVTLSILFILYAFAATLHAEPAITILLFGLLLENGHHVSDWIRKYAPKSMHSWIDFPVKKRKQIFSTLYYELSFLVRTFFFVVIGLLFDFKSFTVMTYIEAAAILIVFYLSRSLSLSISLKLFSAKESPIGTRDVDLGRAILPRGLATAVMALLVYQAKIEGTENLVPIAFLSILGTNLLMVFLLRKTNTVIE